MKKGRLNILILLILIGCTQQSNKNKGEFHSENISLSPAVFTINHDSLKIFIPGKKGFLKPIASLNNKPMFAELAIMNIFLADEWEARWVETYGKGKENPIFLNNWVDDKYANQIHTPILDEEIINLLALISKNNTISYFGCWDVLDWKGDHLIFSESKRTKKDKLRQTQRNWFFAGLQSSLTTDNFLIVEWDWNQGPGSLRS